MIQSILLYKIGQFNTITVTSMIFSFLSIIVSIISTLTHKRISNSYSYGVAQFDMTGSVIIRKVYQYKYRVNKIRNQIAAELGLKDPKLVEIIQPKLIPGGLRMKMRISLNYIQTRHVNYQQELNNLQSNGNIARIIKDCWKLENEPVISRITFKIEESEDRKRNQVSIKMNSASSIGSMQIQYQLSASEVQSGETNIASQSSNLPPPPPRPQVQLVSASDFNMSGRGEGDADIINIINATKDDEYEDSLDRLQLQYLEAEINEAEDEQQTPGNAMCGDENTKY